MLSKPPVELLIKRPLECPLGSLLRGSLYLKAAFTPPIAPLENMRVMGAYSLVYLLVGGGRYVDANGVDQTLRAGDLVQIFPELGHRYVPNPHEDWKEINLVFDGPVFDLWRRQGLLNDRHPVRRLEPVGYWSSRFESLARSSSEQLPLDFVCHLTEFLAEINGYEQTQGLSVGDRAWLDRAKMLLKADIPLERFQLEQVAWELGESYVNFRKKFTRLAGVSPARFHMKAVIDRACELMRQKRMSNREVTERLGFSSEYYFSRRFKQVTGIGPREFRRQVKQQKADA